MRSHDVVYFGVELVGSRVWYGGVFFLQVRSALLLPELDAGAVWRGVVFAGSVGCVVA